MNPKDMSLVKITPTGSEEECLILFLNEDNTLHQDELHLILKEFWNGKREGETFGIMGDGTGGCWEVAHMGEMP